jgi:hypothetical protein
MEQLHVLVTKLLDKYVLGSHHLIHQMLFLAASVYRGVAMLVPDESAASAGTVSDPANVATLASLRRQLDRRRLPWHRTDWPAGCSDRRVVMATSGQAMVDALASAECALVSSLVMW